MLKRNILWAVLLIFLGACGTSAPQGSITVTAQPSAIGPTVTEAASGQPLQRPTLPPTWTPTDAPTFAGYPTPTPNATLEALQADPELAARCADFGPDVANSTDSIVIGNSVQITWTGVAGTSVYEITLADATGARIHTARQPAGSTSYTFSADLFQGNSRYGWLVIPYDSAGRPLCLPRGMEIRTRLA